MAYVRKYAKTYYEKHKEECRRRAREYAAKHREKRRAYYRAYRQKLGKAFNEKYRETHRQYHIANRDRILQYQKERRLKRLEERKAAYRQWRANNRDKHKASNDRRRAAKASALRNDLTAAQWHTIKEHYGHRCVYCDRKMQRLTQDHITPLSKGGSHTMSNIVPACQSCNSKKGTGNILKPIQPLLL